MTAAADFGPLPLIEPYPERADVRHHWLDAVEGAVTGACKQVLLAAKRRQHSRALGRIAAMEAELSALSDSALQARGRDLRDVVRRSGLRSPLVADTFAVVREVSRRTLGMRHYDEQILGGLVLLEGAVAEMDTGEGKTLTAALPVAAAVFAGIPVHVITANDYLAARDAEELRPLYGFLGIKVAAIIAGMPADARAHAYSQDVVYASNKEIAFDYLRDRIVLGHQPNFLRRKLDPLVPSGVGAKPVVMRGLHFAIVDEADSVLVDEARTPLIISRETELEHERLWTAEAFQLVEGFISGQEFRVLADERRIELTTSGKSILADRGQIMGGGWSNRVRREEAAIQALSAMLLFKKGEHYLVRDGQVQIVDEYTGRVMPDRSWSDGLHQLIEAKEGCAMTGRKLPVARMTTQRFFRRYLRLSGMTGTAREVRPELWSVYGLPVSRIPPHAPPKRSRAKPMICTTQEQKLRTIVARVAALHEEGRPVLIGTRSVLASQSVSQRLNEAGLDHVVLNAEHSADEARVIACAGQLGRITVATNMAGRGVDIAVDAAALERGGLHVILTERHDARRIDRQLEGRTGRRGEPGTVEHILSLEDPLLELLGEGRLQSGARSAAVAAIWIGNWLFRSAQRRAERSHSRQRKALLAQDRRLNVLLAFSGSAE